MEHLLQTLQQNDELIRRWGYALLFAASWLEGLNAMIIGGFMVAAGKFNMLATLSVMTAGHACAGFMWYSVGFFGGAKPLDRWGRYIGLTPSRLLFLRSYFAKHSGKAVFITKLTVGLTLATLVTAGTLRMRLKKFAVYNALGSLAWALVTMFFGYTFGLSFQLLRRYVESFTRLVIIFFALLGGAIALWHILRFVFRKKLSLATNPSSLNSRKEP